MKNKKCLFKRVSLIIFFLITFFSLKINSYVASFPYDKFDWDSFLKQHKDYWVSSYCEEDDNDCVDDILKTKEKFYKRLYELLAKYDKKGYHIDDNIIIETVFYGLTPDSFSDYDKKEEKYPGQEIESSYNIDESEDKDKYIADIGDNIETALSYFEKETDSLKTLMNNMIGYYRECYGYVGPAFSSTDSNGNSSLTCGDSRANLIDGECWVSVRTIKTNYFDSIGFSGEATKLCSEATKDYTASKLGESSYAVEVNEEIYWDFLINNNYFDNKFQLQNYFSNVLHSTGHTSMSELTNEEYKKYDKEIKEARTRIVNNIKDILGSYGEFVETPNSSWVYISGGNFSYSSGNGSYWWPIGSDEVTSDGDVKMAIGTPSSTYVTSRYGARVINGTPDMHNGVDIAGTTGVTNVIASKAGIVIYSTLSAGISCTDSNNNYGDKCGGGYGNYVVLQHNDGSYTLYAHLAQNSVTVNNGDNVLQGQVVGKVGSSGSSTGGHLHFEIRIGVYSSSNTVDPLLYISATEPRKTPLEFKYDEDGNVISDGSLSNATLFIQNWEGTPKSEGNDYIAYDDGYGYVTIGWGVVPKFNKSKFLALGVNPDNIVVGSRVSKEIVDTIKAQIVQELSDTVKLLLSNNSISLEHYQIDALISRAYNCGSGSLSGFPSAYKTYGVSQALYDNYLYKPYTSNGKVSKGLKRRRMSEWLLFSQGQYEITV